MKFIDVFNFAPIVVGGLFVVIGLWWLLSARKWFKGPKVMGSPEELAAIEAELEARLDDSDHREARSGRAAPLASREEVRCRRRAC